MNRDQVITTLESYGARVGLYDQTADADNFVAKGQVDEGYCRGVALDWLRRTLQGGKLSYPSGKEDHARARTLRMATMQLRLKNANFSGSWEMLYQEGQRTLDILNSDSAALVKLYNGHLASAAAPISAEEKKILEKYWTFTPPLGTEISMKLLDSCIDGMPAKQQAQRAVLNDMGKSRPTTWDDFVSMMDKYFAETRTEANRKTTNKPFSGLRKGVSFEQRKQYGSIDAATSALLDELKQPWMAQLAGFGLNINVNCNCPGGGEADRDSGHAIAVLYRGPVVSDAYFLFEPNYGVFRYNREGVQKAIKFLFDPAQAGPYNEKGQFFCKNGVQHDGTIRPTGALRYTVFFPENPPQNVAPVQAPKQVPVPASRQPPPVQSAVKRPPMPSLAIPGAAAVPNRAVSPTPTVPGFPRPNPGVPTMPSATPPTQGTMSVSDARNFWKQMTGEQ